MGLEDICNIGNIDSPERAERKRRKSAFAKGEPAV